MFKLLNLLTEKGDETTGPMSPVLAGKELVNQGMIKSIDGLARVLFDDTHVHQVNEGSRSDPEWTGHDTLVAVHRERNADFYAIFIDMGGKLLPVAMHFSDDPLSDAIITPIYKQKELHQKLTDEQIHELFDMVKRDKLIPKKEVVST